LLSSKNPGYTRGLTNSWGTLYTVAPGKNSRSCIYIRNHINALPLLEFCCRDATTVRIIYTCGGGNRELVVSSAYLPYDSDEPPLSKEVRDIIDYCYSRKKQLIIRCDANAHHTLWGSTGVNQRGESLMEYLVN
jgi:splicing factor 45